MTAEPLTPEDLQALRAARDQLENPGLTARLADLVGTPLEKGLQALPRGAADRIGAVVDTALDRCLRLALRTLGPGAPADPSGRLHKVAAGVSGGLGGFFGLLALPVELPVTTTMMFRSICEIARAAGEDLETTEARLQCMSVFALGAGGSRSTAHNATETGYFAVRAALATEMKAALQALSAGGEQAAKSLLVRLLTLIARRFSIVVTEQLAAKAIPVVGAALGAGINVLFMDHFQGMARAHFTVRRLERRYGTQAVRLAYENA